MQCIGDVGLGRATSPTINRWSSRFTRQSRQKVPCNLSRIPPGAPISAESFQNSAGRASVPGVQRPSDPLNFRVADRVAALRMFDAHAERLCVGHRHKDVAVRTCIHRALTNSPPLSIVIARVGDRRSRT
jgi:hypothetical protein